MLKRKGNREVQNLADELRDGGFDVRALMSPTVRRGQEALRICLHAFNTIGELQELIGRLKI